MSTSPKVALLEEYALVARALSAPARLMILEQLAQGERGVDSLAEKTGLTIANCSRHLQQLRRAGLVTSRREGKAVIYRLTDAKTLQLMDLLRVVAERNLAQVERILRGLSGGVTVLDIRPPDEFAAGHIPGAVNAMLADLERIIPSFTPGREIVAYCRGPYCIYAHQAVTALRKRGLNARRMDGGLPEWREDGREVETVLDGG